MQRRTGTHPVFRALGIFLVCLLDACQSQAPLPLEAAALQQELAHRFDLYRQAMPGFEAEGSVAFTDAEGTQSAADWLLFGQREQAIELQLRSKAANEPEFALRASQDDHVAVWLHAPGGREATLYQADPADLDVVLAEPPLAPLRLLLQTLKSLAAPADFKVEQVEPYRNGSELLALIRTTAATAQLRLRRADAMPVFISAELTNPAFPGCLEIAFPDKPTIAAAMADVPAAPALHLPTEVDLAWLPCCTGQAATKLRVRLRAFRIGKPPLHERPTGRVLPLRDLPRDRLWKEFVRGVERNQSTNLCPSQEKYSE